MKVIVEKKGYVARKYERDFEEELFDYLEKNNIKFIELNKFALDDDINSIEIKYDLLIGACSSDVRDKIEEDTDFYLCDYDENGCTLICVITFISESEDTFFEEADEFVNGMEKSLGVEMEGSDKEHFQYYIENTEWGIIERFVEE